MPTSALYHWSVAGSPVNVLIDLPVVDRFRVASTSAETEIGGLLLGHFDGAYTVVTDFEPLESEHRRGSGYTLSLRDEGKLRARLEGRRKRGAAVVGFFRSHLRAGMYLDEGDFHVISSYFSGPNQVVLLVKPSPDRTAVGGFFFWEEGEMNRKQTYLPFPMSARDLELGDFPLVEPVPGSLGALPPAAQDGNGHFDTAETLDIGHAVPIPLPPPSPASPSPTEERSAPQMLAEPLRRREPEPEPEKVRASSRSLQWPLIGIIAACAAFGGYLIGTAGSNRDRFGARAGDITLNPNPEPPEAPAPKPAPAPTAANDASRPTAFPADPAASRATPPTADQLANQAAAANSVPQSGIRAQVPAAPPPVRAKAQAPAPVPTSLSVAGQTPDQASAGWQRFHTQAETAPAPAPPVQTAEARPAPEPAPVVAPPPAAPVAESSVSLESVEAGSVSRAISKIPLLGSLRHSHGSDDFTPPQAVKSFAPRVPQDLARELTGTLPVDLRLTVDKSGHVSSVSILSRQTAAEWVRLAGDAAYDWQFEPARVKDKPVSSDVIAHFRFRPVL